MTHSLEYVNAVNHAGLSIAWYHKGGADVSSSQSIGKNVVNFFKSAIARTTSSDSGADNSEGDPDCVPATLTIRDSPETEKPEIFVDPTPVANANSTNGKKRAVGYKLNIQLSRVGQVDVNPNNGIIRIMAKAPKRSGNEPLEQLEAKCLVALQLTKGLDMDVAASADERDSFVHNILVLMEWERQRRVQAQEHDTIADEENAAGGNFLTQRATKAAHFAKRELELQASRRQRESRKAKLVSEGGGLKYTALAMVRNAENAA